MPYILFTYMYEENILPHTSRMLVVGLLSRAQINTPLIKLTEL
jgi:hypothetical protein